MKIYSFIFPVLSLIFPLLATVPDINKPIQTAMIEDLESAKYNISVKYGPADWKKEQFGWNLDREFELAKNRILSEKVCTIKDYQRIFRAFLLTTKDYHVNAIFYSTEWSFCPLSVKGIRGRYFITRINREWKDTETPFECDEINMKKLKKNLDAIAVGDEIIAMNGVPILEVIEQLIEENFAGDKSPTGYALAEKNLFFRKAKFTQHVPTGVFELTLSRKGKKEAFKCRLPWYHVSEWVANHALKDQIASAPNKQTPPNISRSLKDLLAKDFSVVIAKELINQNCTVNGNENEEEGAADLRKKGFLPPCGKILWESEKNKKLYAYLYRNQNKQNIGYIYLPTFDYDQVEIEAIMTELIEIVQKFENESDALIFDITENYGGDLMFMYAVLSFFADKPLKVTMHREMIIQQDVYNAAVMYNQIKATNLEENLGTVSGYPVDATLLDLLKKYASTIMHTWESGQRLTPLLYLNGVDEVIAHPKVHYTKPMIVLTNELDFSCADFFPAIMQDNKRAKIFGQRTAGAGGHVRTYPHTSRFGIQHYSLTASIAYRPDGTPMENIGVIPDILYEITEKDIRKQYRDYIQAVNNELIHLIN